MEERKIKIVYGDETHKKVLKGYYISEDDFLIKVRGIFDGKIISIGKKSIIQINEWGDC